MSFIGFLYKGERPESDSEKVLRAEMRGLRAQIAFLEAAAAPPATLSTTGAPAASEAPSEGLAMVKAKGQLKIATLIAYAMTGFGTLDLVGIIVLLVIGRDVPDFMQLFFSGIVGYFGGALNAYMGVK